MTRVNSKRVLQEPRIALFILSLSTILQVIFLFSVRISFECDSLAYYNSALGYMTGNDGLVSPYRGPIYPLILNLFTVTTIGNLYPLLISQAILGSTMPLVVYLTLRKSGRTTALIGTGLFCVSSVPFTSAKLVLAEQFFLFFIIVSIYFLSRMLSELHTIKITSWRNFIIFSSLACFTRWEGLALPIAVVTCLALASIKQSKLRSYTLKLTLCFILIFATYGGIRAIFYDNLSMFGLQNGTGSQWLWRQYYSMGFRDFSGEIDRASGAFKGDSTQSVYKLTIEYVKQNESEFEFLKQTAKDSKFLDPERLSKMSNEEGSIRVLLNDAWRDSSTSGSQVTFLMSRAVISRYGLVKGDRLLQQAAIEILKNESSARAVVIQQGLALLGFDKLNLNQKIQWFEGPPLNIGGCLESTNSRFIAQHNSVYPFYSEQIHEAASFARNIIRACFPIGLIASLILSVLLRKFNLLAHMLILAAIINSGIVSVTGGGPYGKYDLSLFTYCILAIVLQTTTNLKGPLNLPSFDKLNKISPP